MIPSINMKKTGENIRRLMKERRISAKMIQRYLGLGCAQSVYKWLNGKGMPTIDNLYALSQLLQVPVDQILYGDTLPFRQEYYQDVTIAHWKRMLHYYVRFHTRLRSV